MAMMTVLLGNTSRGMLCLVLLFGAAFLSFSLRLSFAPSYSRHRGRFIQPLL